MNEHHPHDHANFPISMSRSVGAVWGDLPGEGAGWCMGAWVGGWEGSFYNLLAHEHAQRLPGLASIRALPPCNRTAKHPASCAKHPSSCPKLLCTAAAPKVVSQTPNILCQTSSFLCQAPSIYYTFEATHQDFRAMCQSKPSASHGMLLALRSNQIACWTKVVTCVDGGQVPLALDC